VLIDWGYRVQRVANRALNAVAKAQTKRPPSTTGKPPVKEQVVHFVNKRMPGGLPRRTARALLDIEDRNYVPIIRDPVGTSSESEAVFYFPGCGSERLFSQVGLATQAMLWHVGVQTVLPPGYLCCGYPQRGAGEFDKAEKNHHRQSSTVSSRREYAELSRYQDHHRQLRHVLRPITGL